MKNPSLPTALIAAATLLFSQAAQADDLKNMEGTWKVESAEFGGKAVEPEDIKDIVVKITGARYEVKNKDKTDAGTLAVDETKKPKTMDATATEGSDSGKVVKAIYEISGDSLRVAYATEGDERPKELATKEGSTVLLLTYKREKKSE